MAELILSDEQLAAFDTDSANAQLWEPIEEGIRRDFPDGVFSVLDVGGGNGLFADRVLAQFPGATVTVLDLSEMLLRKNRLHPRKRTILNSALAIDQFTERYDLVCYNWVLHHLIGSTYQRSLANIRKTLTAGAALLTKRGRISVYENIVKGVHIDALPSRLIYALTSLRSLSRIVRAAGANTAGVGVCFQSDEQLRRHFDSAGLRIRTSRTYAPFTSAQWTRWRWLLQMQPAGPAHFWLE